MFNENQVGVVEGNNVIDISSVVDWNNQDSQASLVKLMGDFDTLKPKIEASLDSCPAIL